jgi:urease accessory protein
MSIHLSFRENLFDLHRLHLPTRYYYFNGDQNYIKLLSIGEGIFPGDRVKTSVELEDSDAVFTTESATKVYPSTGAFGVNKIEIKLVHSNLEFINDELILYQGAKFLQLLTIRSDRDSTFFYGDLLSHGRSYEYFDFDTFGAKNSFYCDGELEYSEKYLKRGTFIKEYIRANRSAYSLFAKMYIRLPDLEAFMLTLSRNGFTSFSFSAGKQMLIGVVSESAMHRLRAQLLEVWRLYRQALGKEKFNLGKQ